MEFVFWNFLKYFQINFCNLVNNNPYFFYSFLKASYQKYILDFKRPSGTSRGILQTKETFFIQIYENEKKGIGECGLLRGLSIDDRPDFEEKLKWSCENINLGLDKLYDALTEFPSIQFGLETAFRSFTSENKFDVFPSSFSEGNKGIAINGLVWMGDSAFMQQQISEKIAQGFTCIKMKIGAIDFQKEIGLLKNIRKQFSASEIELRVDANGAFSASEAMEKLKILSEYDLHSIEQPIKQGQLKDMARLCEKTPLPIALDEELIGVFTEEEKNRLLKTIKPQYIILKPSLIGGFRGSDSWIAIAEKNDVDWWITSALESNVGLNAISQYTFTKCVTLPQGLGTGGLYTNNLDSPLEIHQGKIWYDSNKIWDLSNLNEIFTE